MNWRTLRDHINTMDEQQLNSDVTIHLVEEDEYFPVPDINYSPENDVLDKNHPFLDVKTKSCRCGGAFVHDWD